MDRNIYYYYHNITTYWVQHSRISPSCSLLFAYFFHSYNIILTYSKYKFFFFFWLFLVVYCVYQKFYSFPFVYSEMLWFIVHQYWFVCAACFLLCFKVETYNLEATSACWLVCRLLHLTNYTQPCSNLMIRWSKSVYSFKYRIYSNKRRLLIEACHVYIIIIDPEFHRQYSK